MRIAIDARKLHDYGIGTYVRNLVGQLARQDGTDTYALICRSADAAFVRGLGPNFEPIIERAGNYSVLEQIAVPFALRRARIDLFHAPHYVVSPLTSVPTVVTIHDCIHLRFPQYLPNRAAHLYARAMMTMAARRARRILTVSQASKDDIQRYLKVSAGKIEVIYNALDERLATPPAEEEITRVRERFQLRSSFILYAGNIKPHKNVDRLIEAFAIVRRQHSELKLLIIGDEISKYQNLRRLVHTFQLHQHVRFLGFVPDETLAVLYRLAAVFVFPSLYEGFGLPPLEAMASGTPVITSNVSSLPEVVDDAALLIDPMNPGAIAEAMRRVLEDPALRADLDPPRMRARQDLLLAAIGGAYARGLSRGSGRVSPVMDRLAETTPEEEASRSAVLNGRRVALVHDWLTGMRGGEKVLESICRLFPSAGLVTLVHVPGAVSAVIERRSIRTSWIQRLPGSARLYRQYLPLFPTAIELLDFDDVDLIISTSHCAAKAVIGRSDAIHVCYCHTPMRYVWDQFDAYFGVDRLGPIGSAAARHVAAWLARWDRETAKRVTRFVANSRHVAGRIARYYNRRATVVHAPVDTSFFTPGAGRTDGSFLVVSALVPYKRVEIAIEAAALAGVRLKIVGTGPDEARLRAIAGPTVEFLGALSNERLREAYRAAQALVLPGEEDFGIAPIESLACGRPVIALARGGACETIEPGTTGRLVAEPGARSFAEAMRDVAGRTFDQTALRARADRFSSRRFETSFREVLIETLLTDAEW